MKIRSGFVANSSSSSFVIAIKDVNVSLPENTPVYIKTLVNKMVSFITEIDTYSYEESVDIVKTEEELQAYFLDQYTFRETWEEFSKGEEFEFSYKDDYEVCLDAINNGYTVVFRDVDYNNNSLSDFFESLPEKNDSEGIYLIKHNC